MVCIGLGVGTGAVWITGHYRLNILCPLQIILGDAAVEY
jgi:hypothetical protein